MSGGGGKKRSSDDLDSLANMVHALPHTLVPLPSTMPTGCLLMLHRTRRR